MSFSSRLWRVMRGYSADFSNADPDELLKELYERRLKENEQRFAKEDEFWKGYGSRRAKPPPKASKATKAPRTGGLPEHVARAYARLELNSSATLGEAKKAWRRMMAKYHPDRFQGDERKREVATRVAAGLTEAYAIIKEFKR